MVSSGVPLCLPLLNAPPPAPSLQLRFNEWWRCIVLEPYAEQRATAPLVLGVLAKHTDLLEDSERVALMELTRGRRCVLARRAGAGDAAGGAEEEVMVRPAEAYVPSKAISQLAVLRLLPVAVGCSSRK